MLGLSLAFAQEQATFHVDVAGGAEASTLLGEWPDPGVQGAAWLALGLYGELTDQSRIGARLWADVPIAPTQSHTDEELVTEPFRATHFGLDVSFRASPERTWAPVVDLGFGRMDLDAYYGGPMTIPTFGVRGGVRRRLGPISAEAAARVGWGATRSLTEGLTDWWTVGLQVGVVVGVR